MLRVYEEMLEECTRRFPDRRIVLGEGCAAADIVLTGEAPGGDEEKQGRPFVGKAGKNLNEFLNVLGFKREDIYITNTVKLRPYRLSEKTGKAVNRPPNKSEREFFEPYLLREIKELSPKMVVTLGNIALQGVTQSSSASIGELHGKIIDMDVFKLFPLYHPAAIIYNPPLKQVYENDLQLLAAELAKAL